MDSQKIDSGKAFSYGWASVKKDLWYFVGLTLIFVIIGSLGSKNGGHSEWNVLSYFLSAWMTCGFVTLALNYQAGKKLPLSNVFTQFKHYWKVLGAAIIVGLLVVAGTAFLIIPGIYFALRFQFVVELILDKGLDIGEAMKESTRLTNGRKMSLLGFNLMMVGVLLLGALCLGVGLLVAIPVAGLANVVVYRQLMHSATAKA